MLKIAYIFYCIPPDQQSLDAEDSLHVYCIPPDQQSLDAEDSLHFIVAHPINRA